MKSIWTESVSIPKREPLRKDMEAEVVIIGAGLAGILTGYMLKSRGVDAVILEADRIAGGQTCGTTAKITSQHNLIYDNLIQTFGYEKAKHYAGFNEWAICEYERLMKERSIDCDFVRCSANLYSCMTEEKLKKEAEAGERLGIPAFYKQECELPFAVKSVLEYKNQARFHPLKFIKEIEGGLCIFEGTRVRQVEETQDVGGAGKSVTKSKVITDRGTVTAEYVVFACHFPFVNMPGYYFARMYQSRSYEVVLKGAKKLKDYYLSVDAPGWSFRPVGELLLFGGEGHRTGEHPQDSCYEKIEEKAQEWFPGCETAVRFSAQDCMTLDGIPYIGEFSCRRRNWYVATGFGKWGMTSSMVSARIISAKILGMEVPEADIFSPDRQIHSGSVRSFAVNQGKAVKNLASMKDTKRCSHLGCKLSWNEDEGTWDCPCHGSRFDRDGHLLSGPAVKELKKDAHFEKM